VASRDGIVTKVYAGCGKTTGGTLTGCTGPHTESFGYAGCSGYGNHVVITHSDGTKSLYGHLKPGSAGTEPGSIVYAGDQIGIEGTSGNSTGNHLHYAVYGAKHTASVVDFAGVYAGALAGDQQAKDTLISAGGLESAYSDGGLDPGTELANVYLCTRLLYETVVRDAETSEPYAVYDWAKGARGKNSYITILCVGGENSLEGDYSNTNLWRPLG
jgi:murein DD-endopeptidase MepM/ murein hydrolase activator NlpD